MASTSFTPNLGLCSWQPSDRPKRIDFVSDNQKIDEILGTHIDDKDVHVTAQEKAIYSSPYKVVTYVGDGQSTRTLSLDKEYTFAIVFDKNSPIQKSDTNGDTILKFALVGRMFGSQSNITLNSNSITVTEDTTSTDGIKNSFNEQYGQYVMILFR